MATDIRFTAAIDRRFAWIGNDATGEINLEAELVAFINSAATSIAVSSMTFSLTAVGDALAAAAQAGRLVRIVGNAGHRFQPGWFRAQRGPVHLVDNNLPALVARVSFQGAGEPAPTGFMIDSGAVFGPRGNGWSYGWNVDVSVDIGPHAAPAAFTSPLLRHCYARPNNVQRTWSIALPPGFYYVVAVTGEASFNSKSFVWAQGQTIFTYKDGSGLHYSDHTDCAAGEFKCSIADGGSDEESGEPQGRRLDVQSGTLTLTVGSSSALGWTSLDYVEIYRASSTHPLGDPGLDRTLVQERQLHHTKFLLLDAGTPSARLWTGSHNLTPIDMSDPRSEDAIVTDEPGICAAFASEFDQWWGGPGPAPDPAAARLGRFKVPVVADGTMPSVLLPGASYPWQVRFSPSSSTAPGVDIYQVVANHLSAATQDVLFLLEQFSDSGDFGTFHGSTYLMNNVLDPKVTSGVRVRGLFGNTDPTDSVFSRYGSAPNAAVQSEKTHDKLVLVDALRDTRHRRLGRLLCGSMNWSQSGMHVNNEQTLILRDPALANQALQRVMAAFDEHGILPEEPADIVIVIDRSFSMTAPAEAATSKMAAARDAADLFLDMITANGAHRVALVRFGVSVEPYAPAEALVPYTVGRRAVLHGKVAMTDATLPIGSATCYGLPLLEAQSLLSTVMSPHPRRVVVFLTDGQENTAPFADGIYQPLADSGVEIHTTAFGDFDPFDTSGPNAILNDMATYSGGTFAQVDDDAIHLQKRFAEVARDAMGMVTILDPTYRLAGGDKVSERVDIDLSRGTLQWCAFWGGGSAAHVLMTLQTPWGQVLTSRSPGVTRLRGRGREIWRVDLERLSLAERASTVGAWVVTLTANPKLKRRMVRVDLAVYASRGGADLRVEVVPRGRTAEVLVRLLDGKKVVAEPRLEVMATLPLRVKTKAASSIRVAMEPIAFKARDNRTWEGVRAGRFELEHAGVYTVRVVAEGPSRREVVRTFAVPPTRDAAG